MLEVFDKISLFIPWDLANDTFSEFRVPNLTINLFLSFTYWVLIIKYSDAKLIKVNIKADQT